MEHFLVQDDSREGLVESLFGLHLLKKQEREDPNADLSSCAKTVNYGRQSNSKRGGGKKKKKSRGQAGWRRRLIPQSDRLQKDPDSRLIGGRCDSQRGDVLQVRAPSTQDGLLRVVPSRERERRARLWQHQKYLVWVMAVGAVGPMHTLCIHSSFSKLYHWCLWT